MTSIGGLALRRQARALLRLGGPDDRFGRFDIVGSIDGKVRLRAFAGEEIECDGYRRSMRARVVADVGLPQPVRDIVDREGRSVIEPDRIQGPTVSPGAAFAENVEVTVRADDTGV